LAWTGCSTTRLGAGSRWFGSCGGIGWRGIGAGWIERYLSVCGVSVEALHGRGRVVLYEELMDGFMALLKSFSGRFYQLRSPRNQQRLVGAAAHRLGQ